MRKIFHSYRKRLCKKEDTKPTPSVIPSNRRESKDLRTEY